MKPLGSVILHQSPNCGEYEALKPVFDIFFSFILIFIILIVISGFLSYRRRCGLVLFDPNFQKDLWIQQNALSRFKLKFCAEPGPVRRVLSDVVIFLISEITQHFRAELPVRLHFV